MSQNLYTYVGNNPVNYVDPTGHFAILAAMAVGALIGAAVGVAATFVADVVDGSLDATASDYLGAAAAGALIGSCAPVVSGAIAAGTATLGTGMLTMGAVGTAASVTEQTISEGQVDYVEAVYDGATTAFTFGTFQGVQMLLDGSFSSTLSPSGSSYQTMSSESYNEAYNYNSNSTTTSNSTPTTQGLSQASKTSQIGNSIYEQVDNNGNVISRSYYDTDGLRFCRQDYNHYHNNMCPHEHNFKFWNGFMAGETVGPLPDGY